MKAARPVVNRFLSVHGGICVRGRTRIYISLKRFDARGREGRGEEAVSRPLNRLEADRGWKAK